MPEPLIDTEQTQHPRSWTSQSHHSMMSIRNADAKSCIKANRGHTICMTKVSHLTSLCRWRSAAKGILNRLRLAQQALCTNDCHSSTQELVLSLHYTLHHASHSRPRQSMLQVTFWSTKRPRKPWNNSGYSTSMPAAGSVNSLPSSLMVSARLSAESDCSCCASRGRTGRRV